jgi:hypothetical protein
MHYVLLLAFLPMTLPKNKKTELAILNQRKSYWRTHSARKCHVDQHGPHELSFSLSQPTLRTIVKSTGQISLPPAFDRLVCFNSLMGDLAYEITFRSW